MVLSTHISSIAERILNEETLSIPDRSEVNMIEVRSLAKPMSFRHLNEFWTLRTSQLKTSLLTEYHALK